MDTSNAHANRLRPSNAPQVLAGFLLRKLPSDRFAISIRRKWPLSSASRILELTLKDSAIKRCWPCYTTAAQGSRRLLMCDPRTFI